MLFFRGTLAAKDGPRGFWIVDLPARQGFSAASVLDSKEEVIGYVLGGQIDGSGALVRPLREVRDILAIA